MLPLFFIFVYSLAKAGIVLIFPSIIKEEAAYFFFLSFTLEALCSPIQGAISDRFSRKKSLVVAFLAIALGQLLIFFSFQTSPLFFLPAIVIHSMLGNGDVIARAALVDLYFHLNRRTIIGWSFIAQFAPWIITAFFLLSGVYSAIIFLYYFLSAFLCMLLSLFVFKDFRDIPKHKKIHHVVLEEIKKSVVFFTNKKHYLGFVGLFFWELAFAFSFYYQDEVISFRFVESQMIIFFVIGFIVGTLSLFHLSISNKQAILGGLTIGIVGYAIALLLSVIRTTWLEQSLGFFIFQFGLGMSITAIYTYFSLGHYPHQQGTLFGVLDSIQTVGEMLSAAILIYAVVFPPAVVAFIVVGLLILSFSLFKRNILTSAQKI